MSDETDTLRVWVGCLACYNAGKLRGEWVDAIDADEMTPERLHGRATSHEELWCLDTDDPWHIIPGECSPMDAARYGRMVEAIQADGYDVGAVVAWRDNGEPLDEWDAPTRERFEDSYAGEYHSGSDYAEVLAGELDLIPADNAWPAYCVDWDRAWHELSTDGYWTAPVPGGGVYIFRPV